MRSVVAIVVFFIFFVIAMFSLTELHFFHQPMAPGEKKLGFGMIGIIFFTRGAGDFRYVGFFKKIRHTPFGRNDTRFYSPLCFLIGMLNGILALSG
jgi:Protein of unknown function (DUF3995)